MRRIHARQRRARLALRHHLAPGAQASDPVEAARDLVGIHATDPASVYLGAFARTPALRIAALERALYDDRSVVRMLGMRRTMFVTPVELAPIVHGACSRSIGVRERRRLIGMLAGAGITTDPEAWLASAEAATMDALEARGEATALELGRDVPALREQIPFGAGRRWAGTMGVSTRVLFLLAMEGRIVRARPRGSWISSQYRWTPVDRWLAGGLPDVPTDVAQVELVRRWLAAFGPGTMVDLRWWTGWTLAEVRRALGRLPAVEVQLNGGTGIVLADDLEAVPEPEPWVALLPALDTSVMGWSEREWFLGGHGPALFDRNGNAGPTVWWDGRVVGGWTQRPDGEIAFRLLSDVGAEATVAVEEAAGRLGDWIGSVRITPRFRTPIDLELGS